MISNLSQLSRKSWRQFHSESQQWNWNLGRQTEKRRCYVLWWKESGKKSKKETDVQQVVDHPISLCPHNEDTTERILRNHNKCSYWFSLRAVIHFPNLHPSLIPPQAFSNFLSRIPSCFHVISFQNIFTSITFSAIILILVSGINRQPLTSAMLSQHCHEILLQAVHSMRIQTFSVLLAFMFHWFANKVISLAILTARKWYYLRYLSFHYVASLILVQTFTAVNIETRRLFSIQLCFLMYRNLHASLRRRKLALKKTEKVTNCVHPIKIVGESDQQKKAEEKALGHIEIPPAKPNSEWLCICQLQAKTSPKFHFARFFNILIKNRIQKLKIEKLCKIFGK